MKTPQRILSLVPSLTELVIDLGLKDRLVGRTRFCVHPKDQVKDIAIIGGTKNPDLQKIRALKPDYIIANKEENKQEHIEELQKEFSVHVTDIATIEDALIAIHTLGKELGVPQKTDQPGAQIQSAMQDIPEVTPIRTAYFIWKDPWMSIGNDTYIHDVLHHWKLENVFADQTRYPKTNFYALAEKDPELILLSSEPFPFKEKHIPEVQQAFPKARVLLVEGEWFSWYGSHMQHAFKRLNTWRKAID